MLSTGLLDIHNHRLRGLGGMRTIWPDIYTLEMFLNYRGLIFLYMTAPNMATATIAPECDTKI